MMGQRLASTCRLDMLPAPGDTWCAVAVVESERSVAGDVLERNGHMDRDWRRIDSMTARGVGEERKTGQLRAQGGVGLRGVRGAVSLEAYVRHRVHSFRCRESQANKARRHSA
jgi:hypothetical protein